jgi:RNA polymerase sigma-70 factor (ECF subfamily)
VSAGGVTTFDQVANASWKMLPDDALIVAELKAGSEDAYARLVAQYQQTIYNLTYRLLEDPSDAPDTTQEVFIKVFRGISNFNCESSLKTWIYRIAVREASNRRRWIFRHKVRELSIEPALHEHEGCAPSLRDSLVDGSESPFECVARDQVRARLEQVLQELPEYYRTAVVLRDIEDLSYEEIAEMTETSLGTVKSRLVRGREALRKRMERYAHDLAPEAGILTEAEATARAPKLSARNREVEVTP